MIKKAILSISFIIIALIFGCESRQQEPPSNPKQEPITSVEYQSPFIKPLEPELFELASGALSRWRDFKHLKPALVLFSKHPLLDPLSDDTKDSALTLISTGTVGEIQRRGSFYSSEPAFLPEQTVSVAIEAGLISELIYVYPSTQRLEEFSLPKFQKRAYEAGFLSLDEAKSLEIHNGVISGTVRGTPFRCVHPEALPTIENPAILHIDLGYFSDLYVNGVKTPPYDLIYKLAKSIQASAYKTLATTLSYSNQEIGFSLETRFVINDLAAILRNPALLSSDSPTSWYLRSQALYLAEMYDQSGAESNIRSAAESNPEDPAALYDLSMLEFKKGNEASGFSSLDQAVQLDRGYGLAYLELAEQGIKLKRFNKSIELLQKAASLFPNNPFIRINLSELLIMRGRNQEARPIIEELKRLPWSEKFHPGVLETLEQLAKDAANDAATPLADPAPSDSRIQQPDKSSGHWNLHQH